MQLLNAGPLGLPVRQRRTSAVDRTGHTNVKQPAQLSLHQLSE